MGKKREAREAAEAAEQAALEAQQAAVEARREAAAEADAEPLSKAERKALKRAAREREQATGVTPEAVAEVFEVPADMVAARPAGKRKGKAAKVAGAVVTDDIDVVPDVVATTDGTVSGELVAPAQAEAKSVEPIERDRWGRPKVQLPDGTGSTGYRRVTTFIDVLEDKSSLDAWGKRNVLEGTALDYSELQHGAKSPSLVLQASSLIGERDEQLGKLLAEEATGPLSLGPARQAALKAYKDGMDALVERAADLAGAHDKATKGTDLHAMSELVDAGQAVPEHATAADRRDLAAYQQAVKQAGIVYTHAEQFVVLDDLGVGGTLDRAGLFKFKGTARARRCVMDLKTGRIDYSAGKIAMQLAAYAHGLAYDRDSGERTDLKLDKSKALLIHLPAGEGRCDIYEVDIAPAWSKAVKLADEVYAWRKTGKTAFDLKAPIVSVQL